MIVFLSGKPKIIDQELCVITGGVGYGVAVTTKTLANLRATQHAELYIYTYVKEDKLELYGFATTEEKKLFLLLISISGVGPKTALGIINAGASAIITAVQEAQVSFFTQAPRVGKKLAQKIIIELTPKLGSIKQLELTPLTTFQTDLSLALSSLGFAESDIETLIRSEELAGMELEKALQYCLKTLGK